MHDEQYELTENVILKDKGFASIQCIVCNILMEIKWYKSKIEFIK